MSGNRNHFIQENSDSYPTYQENEFLRFVGNNGEGRDAYIYNSNFTVENNNGYVIVVYKVLGNSTRNEQQRLFDGNGYYLHVNYNNDNSTRMVWYQQFNNTTNSSGGLVIGMMKGYGVNDSPQGFNGSIAEVIFLKQGISFEDQKMVRY